MAYVYINKERTVNNQLTSHIVVSKPNKMKEVFSL